MKNINTVIVILIMIGVFSCKKASNQTQEPNMIKWSHFCMGADLSYVNQIQDFGGVYKDSGVIKDPYQVFKQHGANVIRLRLWHNPIWSKEVYGSTGKQMYNDIKDVEKSIKRAKDLGIAVNLDFHYSDTWADPSKQTIPAAWKNITTIDVLKDSVYQYTFKTLTYLSNKGLMPEMVQIGNEINCGMLWPLGKFCDVSKLELGILINSGIKAVRDVSVNSAIKTLILLHVAQPENVEWWFDDLINKANVSDFDIVGFSYYSLWSKVPLSDIRAYVAKFKIKYNKKVMILETAFPWTKNNADSYGNILPGNQVVQGYDYTTEGQYNYMVQLTQNVISAGGSGVMYWEPAWISSGMKDLWGTGSAWDNSTFFDFNGNTLKGIDFMNYSYKFP